MRYWKVLLIVEAANPEWVSVPLVGWSMATAIRKLTTAHIVTQVRNRDAFVRAGLTEGKDFTIIDTESIARPLWRLANLLRGNSGRGWTIDTAIASLVYPYFEYLVWKKFSRRIRDREFDFVHRITPLTPTAQSSLARKCARIDVPFILGPLNGGIPWPKQHSSLRRAEMEWLSYVREAYKIFPNYGASFRYASAILAGSWYTASTFPSQTKGKVLYIPENGIDPERFNMKRPITSGPMRVAFVGRLVPYKGPDIVLEALAPFLREGTIQLDIVGDGPMRNQISDWILGAGLTRNVELHGWVNHHEVQSILAKSQIFAFPSIREFGGGVVLEAMALGVIPVVVDYGGPGEIVLPELGIKLKLSSREDLVKSLRAAIGQLMQMNLQALEKMSFLCRERIASHYTWDAKAKQILSVYDWVARAPALKKPEFF